MTVGTLGRLSSNWFRVSGRRAWIDASALARCTMNPHASRVRIGTLGPQRLCELHPFRLRPVPPLETAPNALLEGRPRHLAVGNAHGGLVNWKRQIPYRVWGPSLSIRTLRSARASTAVVLGQLCATCKSSAPRSALVR